MIDFGFYQEERRRLEPDPEPPIVGLCYLCHEPVYQFAIDNEIDIFGNNGEPIHGQCLMKKYYFEE